MSSLTFVIFYFEISVLLLLVSFILYYFGEHASTRLWK